MRTRKREVAILWWVAMADFPLSQEPNTVQPFLKRYRLLEYEDVICRVHQYTSVDDLVADKLHLPEKKGFLCNKTAADNDGFGMAAGAASRFQRALAEYAEKNQDPVEPGTVPLQVVKPPSAKKTRGAASRARSAMVAAAADEASASEDQEDASGGENSSDVEPKPVSELSTMAVHHYRVMWSYCHCRWCRI